MLLRIFITLCLLAPATAAMSQELGQIPGAPENALIFVDSIESKKGLEGLDPTKIALIDIVKGSKLKEKYGPRGENGVIFVETVPFARKRYTRMFSEFSPAYGTQLQKSGSDSSFQYVLDGSPLSSNVPQMLAALEKKTIDSVTVMTPEKVKQVNAEYEADGKLLWVLITSKTK
jgi:hypothetical protein